MTRSRCLVTLAVTTVLSVGLAPAATAATLAHDEARGDVVQISSDESGPGSETPAPEVADVDIVRSVVAHKGKRVVLTLVLAELERSESFRFFGAELRTNTRLRRTVGVVTVPEGQRGQVFMERPKGGDVPCEGLRHVVDHDRDRVRISVPRRCLDAPRWIRAGVGAVRFDDEFTVTYADDGRREGTVGDSHLRLSPRVRRG